MIEYKADVNLAMSDVNKNSHVKICHRFIYDIYMLIM